MTVIPMVGLLYLLGTFTVGTLWILAWVLGFGKRRRRRKRNEKALARIDEILDPYRPQA